MTKFIGKGSEKFSLISNMLSSSSYHLLNSTGFHCKQQRMVMICEIIPVALCNVFWKLMFIVCVMTLFLMDDHAFLMCISKGSLSLSMLISSLNHSVKSSLIALTKGCPLGPYATHSVEYLHLPCDMPVAFAADISILFHSALDNPWIWNPHVALEYPAPEYNTLAPLEICAIFFIFAREALALLILVLNMLFLIL